MKTNRAKAYPLHYDRVRELHVQGVPEHKIVSRLRVSVFDVREWTKDLPASRLLVPEGKATNVRSNTGGEK
jgi:hypothetical protein